MGRSNRPIHLMRSRIPKKVAVVKVFLRQSDPPPLEEPLERHLERPLEDPLESVFKRWTKKK